ncbi:MAG: hypothetical protein JNM59_04260 [Hyphomonadaceae bacterium]|nr:hypothetical protein [Hyphomonadaceae bacterium]
MSISRRGLLAAVAGGCIASGCATIPLVKAGPYRARGAGFAVTLSRPWSDLTAMSFRPTGVRVLSIDGVQLNQLVIATIEPQGALVRMVDRDTPRPLYRSDMGETELVEFVIDSLATLEYQDPQSTNLRPQNLAGAPGVRFDINTRTEAGLNITGTALVARAGENLNLLMFLAPSEHYYGVFAQEIDAVFASAAT